MEGGDRRGAEPDQGELGWSRMGRREDPAEQRDEPAGEDTRIEYRSKPSAGRLLRDMLQVGMQLGGNDGGPGQDPTKDQGTHQIPGQQQGPHPKQLYKGLPVALLQERNHG